jgi:hypothetical protein
MVFKNTTTANESKKRKQIELSPKPEFGDGHSRCFPTAKIPLSGISAAVRASRFLVMQKSA